MFNTAIGVLTLGAIIYLTRRVIRMSAELDRLTTEVSENTTVINSAITLINGLAQQIRDNATDPVALTALADQLDAQSTALSEAVAANTPAGQQGGSSRHDKGPRLRTWGPLVGGS